MNDLTNYLKMFGLKVEETSLKILLCIKDRLDFQLKNVRMADLKGLPKLPYSDQSFELALCSQILFMDDTKHTESFHVELLLELCRVANEVKVWPVLKNDGHPSLYLGPVLKTLQEKSLGVELKEINSQKKVGQALLRIWQPACKVLDKKESKGGL